MKRTLLEPTDENICSSIQNNLLDRNSTLVDFLSLLDNIDGHFSISLDGEWGSGKTFLFGK